MMRVAVKGETPKLFEVELNNAGLFVEIKINGVRVGEVVPTTEDRPRFDIAFGAAEVVSSITNYSNIKIAGRVVD